MRFLRWHGVVLGLLALACGSEGDRKAPRDPQVDAAPDVIDAAKPVPDAGPDATDPDAGPVAPDAPDVPDAPDADAGPFCGNQVVEGDEECDDGNDVPGDGCEPDCTGSACTQDADCVDIAFCNGSERCANGTCVAGTPPVTTDNLDCTVDRCDEATDTIVHEPDDNVCNGLDQPPTCATSGTHSGKVVKQEGVCTLETGCQPATLLIEDCLDDTLHPTTYSCAATGAARILRHDGACIAATATCGTVDSVQTDCASAIPSPHPHCSGSAATSTLVHHYSAQATCGGGANPACSFTESTTACTPGNPSCTGGQITGFTATCTASGGCGQGAVGTASCADSPDTCTTGASGPVFTRFTPACASATACGPATPTPTNCTAPGPTCTNAQLTTRTPTCALPGGCAVSTSTSACADSPDTCTTGASGPVFTTFTPACASGTACGPAAATPTTCTAPGPTCTNAQLTTRTASCALPGGCAVSTSTSACADSPDTCTTGASGPVFTTYAPACASGTACGPAAATPTTCTAPGSTCTNAQLTTNTPTCALPGGCDVSSSTTACTAGADICVSGARVPTSRSFTAACNTAGNGCVSGGTPTDTACPDQADSCSSGSLTTYAPNCTGAGICGITPTVTSCPDSPTTCTGGGPSGLPLVLTRFTPTCASGSACGTPTSTQTTCTASAPTCTGLTHSTFTPTCSTATESCGTAITSTDCTLNATRCTTDVQGQQVLETLTGICDPFKGCGTTSSTRLCNQQRCLNSTTLLIESGSCPPGGTACGFRTVTCVNSCVADKCN